MELRNHTRKESMEGLAQIGKFTGNYLDISESTSDSVVTMTP